MTETLMEDIQALTPAEAAKVLRVSVRTLALWRQYRKGPRFFMAGSLPRYRVADIARWQKDRMVAQVRPRCRR